VNDSPPRNYNPEWLRGEDERRGPREIYSSLSHLSLCRSDPWSDILKTTVSKPPTNNPQRTQRHLSPGKKHRATKLVYAAREQMAFPAWSCSRCCTPLRTAFQNPRSRLEYAGINWLLSNKWWQKKNSPRQRNQLCLMKTCLSGLKTLALSITYRYNTYSVLRQ